MNLLFVTAEYPPDRCGGIGVFYQDLARQLSRRGSRVTVVAPSTCDDGKGSDGDVTVHRWRGSLAADSAPGMLVQRLRFTRFVEEIAHELAPDLIETHDWSGPLTGAPGSPFVVRLHGAHTVIRRRMNQRPSTAIRLFERRLLQSADSVVAVSNWIGRQTVEAFGTRSPAAVIPNGIDAREFLPLPAARSEQELLFVGGVKPGKGVFELFRALPRVLSRCPSLSVRMVGPEASGVREGLRASIPAAVSARVRFDGAVERHRLPAVYSSATVCVLPSITEAFGLTMAEAMSCGVPIVGSSLGAGPELADNGRQALIVDPRDTPALAAAIVQCLESQALRQRLSSEARRRAVRDLSWDVVAARNERFYLKVIEGAQKWPKSA